MAYKAFLKKGCSVAPRYIFQALRGLDYIREGGVYEVTMFASITVKPVGRSCALIDFSELTFSRVIWKEIAPGTAIIPVLGSRNIRLQNFVFRQRGSYRICATVQISFADREEVAILSNLRHIEPQLPFYDPQKL